MARQEPSPRQSDAVPATTHPSRPSRYTRKVVIPGKAASRVILLHYKEFFHFASQ